MALNKYLKSYISDTWFTIRSPYEWTDKYVFNFLALSTLTTSSMLFDEKSSKFFFQSQSKGIDKLNKYVFEPFGSGVYSIPLLAILYCSSGYKKNQKNKEIALDGIKAFIISEGFAIAGKQLFHRHRPNDDNPSDPYKWDGPDLKNKNTSFPSGHTTTVFAVATVLARGYKDKKWVGITSYSVAIVTGISRIYDKKHWFSDVIAGATLGSYIGYVIVDKKSRIKKPRPLSIGLGFNSATLRYKL